MIRRPATLAPAILGPVALATFALGASAAAQSAPGDTVNQVIVYGEEECPQSSGDEIVVCARKPESERYRIPQLLRRSTDPANQSWAERAESFELVGDFGILSCTPAGLGSEFGCTQQLIDAAYEERDNSTDVRFGQLIEEERARRLATIDAEAAATQERVEMIEREYEARLAAEREGPVPGEEVDPTPPDAGMLPPDRLVPVEPSKPGPFDGGGSDPQPVDASAPAQIGIE